MTLQAAEIIIRPVISEKSMDETQRGKYTFAVHDEANKLQIKAAVEELFKVSVLQVNVLTTKAKEKRRGLCRQRTVDILVESEHEEFVLRVHRFRKPGAGRNHQITIRRHAAAAIDEQADGNGRILITEKADLLLLLVLEDAKGFLSEATNVAAPLVLDGNVQHHEL